MALHATPHLFFYLALLASILGLKQNFPGFAVWSERLPRSNLVVVMEIPFMWTTVHIAPAMWQQRTNIYLQMLNQSTVSFDFLKVVVTSKNLSWASGGIVSASFPLRPGLMSSSRISGGKTNKQEDQNELREWLCGSPSCLHTVIHHGPVSTSFVMARLRMAPEKCLSMPHLELSAAFLDQADHSLPADVPHVRLQFSITMDEIGVVLL